MNYRRSMLSPLAVLAVLGGTATAFVPHHRSLSSGTNRRLSPLPSAADDEAKALLERVRKMREEIASLEGRSVEDVEKEATDKKALQIRREREMEAEREERARTRADAPRYRTSDGKFMEVPGTAEEQVRQASEATARAFRDGLTRQVVRFELMREDDVLNEDRNWPGGAEQMYREAAGPLTRALLSEVRAPTSTAGGEKDSLRVAYKPNVTSEDIWDFDGSALITAHAATGPEDNVKAMVLPNTDNKYTNDIKTLDAEMSDRLFLLVNPFWRNIDSWGINLLAPRAKQLAQEAIFDRGFNETYCLLRKSVRGEDCIALKAYPYDWQLFAFIENEAWPYEEMTIRLGETKEEPTSVDFAELLEGREEFKLNKNMRMLQRMRK